MLHNLFSTLSVAGQQEHFETLLQRPGCRIERIVSHGQASPPGFWYDQDWDEWILLLAGSAGLQFDTDAPLLELAPGDYLHIPAGTRHRVAYTAEDAASIWLAIHFD